jgi:hypothetical protein
VIVLKASRAGLAATLALSIMLQACIGSGADSDSSGGFSLFDSSSDEELTPEERALREEADVFNETVFGGAATGALLLGGLCVASALLGGGNNMGRCAILAGVGAAAGALDGYLIAKRQESSRTKVREIDLVTQDVEADNRKIEQVNDRARRVRDQNLERIREAEAKRRSQQISAEQLATERRRLQSNIDFLQDTIDKLEERRNKYHEAAQSLSAQGSGSTAELQTKIEEQTRKIQTLKQMKRDLEKANEVKRIG